MLFDLFDYDKLRRAAAYALVLVVVLFLQNTLLAHVAPLGVHALLLPTAVVAVAVCEDGFWGGLFGLCLGVLADLNFLETHVLFTLLLPAIGFGAGALAERSVNRRLFSCLLLCLMALLLTALCQMFRLLVFLGAQPLPLIKTALLQTLWSLPFVPLCYYPCRAISRRLS